MVEKIQPCYFDAEDEYEYTVVYPKYMTYVGNLVASRKSDDFSVFIWPGIGGNTEYGVSFTVEGVTYQIMVDKSLKAIDILNQKLIDEYKRDIVNLFEVANRKWEKL